MTRVISIVRHNIHYKESHERGRATIDHLENNAIKEYELAFYQ